MKVKVLKNTKVNTEQFILYARKGREYTDDTIPTETLEWLLANGHAELVEPPVEIEVPPQVELETKPVKTTTRKRRTTAKKAEDAE